VGAGGVSPTDEQLAKQAKATSTVKYEISGTHIKVTRTHTVDGNDLTTVNEADFGKEAEFNTQGHKIKAIVEGNGDALNLKATSGWATGSAKVVGGQLVESITHNESGKTVTSTWNKA